MFKKTKSCLAAIAAASLFGGIGANFFKTSAATGDVWMNAYLGADAGIDAKEQTSGENNEFYAVSSEYKTTDWTANVPLYDENRALVNYYGGGTIGGHIADGSVGSAETVAESTTKLKLARSKNGAGVRYAYPVQLDGLVMYVNFEQVKLGDELRFTFGSDYNAFTGTGKGVTVELSQYNQVCIDNNWVFSRFRRTEGFAEPSEGVTGSPLNDWYCADENDGGGKTFKFEFSVEEDGGVVLDLYNHRNHPLDTISKKSWTISASAAQSFGLIDGDGNTWIQVSSYANANNSNEYTRFAVKVEDAKREAYKENDYAAAKSALAAYSVSAIDAGEVDAENLTAWNEKKDAAVAASVKLRVSDYSLLDVKGHMEAADEALSKKAEMGAEGWLRDQVNVYGALPVETLDEIHEALKKRDAIGDYSELPDAETLAGIIAQKDSELLAAADGLLAGRMTEIKTLANGIDGYQQALRAEELKLSVTDRDLLVGQSLQLEKLEEYQKAIADMAAAKQAFETKLSESKFAFLNSFGQKETSVNDLKFVEKGMEVTFTGGGRELSLEKPIDIEKGVRAIFTVDEWAYLSNIYNPNHLYFFISPKRNTYRSAASLACMLFTYEDCARFSTYCGQSNDTQDNVTLKKIEAGDGSYVSLEFKHNPSKSRYEITLEYLDENGTVIDYAASYIGYQPASETIGNIAIDADTYKDGAYLYLGSWMTMENFKNSQGEPDASLMPDSLFNKYTFKVFGDILFDESYAVDYISGISVKEGSMKSAYKVGDKIDLTGAMLIVTKESGATEEVEIKRSMVTGFSSKKEGTVTLKITYEGFTTSFDITVSASGVSDSSGAEDSGSVSGSSGTSDSGGCGSAIGFGLSAVSLLGAAIALTLQKRKEK